MNKAVENALAVIERAASGNFVLTYSQIRNAHATLAAHIAEQDAVATVCLRGDTYGHDNFIEVQLQKAPGVDLPIGTKLYSHPPASVAVTQAMEAMVEAAEEIERGHEWITSVGASAIIRKHAAALLQKGTK